MNVPETIERAILDVIRNYGAGAGVTFRCWHSLKADTRWTKAQDRVFPCIDIRTSAPSLQDDDVTLTASTQLTICTKVADDQDHALINSQEQATQEALDALFSQYRADSGTIWTAFKTQIETDCNGLSLGGLSFGDSLSPEDDNGVNKTGITLIVHYSRNDF